MFMLHPHTLQIPRVAHHRGMSEQSLTQLVNQFIEKPLFGIFGEPYVNILMLNLALDGIELNK